MDARRSALWLATALLMTAGMAFTQPLNISNTPGVPSVSPRLAVDSEGNVHSVWVEQSATDAKGGVYGDVYYAMGDLGKLQISAPVKLSSSATVHCETVEMAAIAIDGSDRVYVVWVESGRIMLRTKTAGGWNDAIVIESGKVYEMPRLAVTPGGDLYVIFWNTEGHVFSRARVGGVWEESRNLGTWSSRSKFADIAVGSTVVGAVFMERKSGNYYYQIGYAQRSLAFKAAWSNSTTVASAELEREHPVLGFDSGDVAHVVWTTLDASEASRVVHYARKSGSGFTSPVEISTHKMLHYCFLDIRGFTVYVIWQVGGYGNGSAVEYNIRGADGVWKGVASVPSSSGCTYSDIAATPDGGIVYFVWDKHLGLPAGEIYGWAKAFAAPNPSITLGTDNLFFGATPGGPATPRQSVSVTNSGPNPKKWTATPLQSWIKVQSGSGSGSGRFTVEVNPGSLSVGTYSGAISVADPNVPQYLPQTVVVTLTVYSSAGGGSGPFGSFDTPLPQSTVRSNVPVTGWALDDVGVKSVKIYRDRVAGEAAGGPVYIGDALFIEGARNDVAKAYPNMPLNRRAGWGYMLLTNFLPGGGNGTITLRAVAEDYEGRTTSLGYKTIVCDNASAVNPFGAIDTPAQGGTAAGSSYVNFGWALTPRPAAIPVDGSTISIWVDGVLLGQPTYNNYRADIATLFPGYANSGGAVGYFYLDTTKYADGVHTIAWSVTDDAGHADGIGSRYFEIFNGGSSSAAAAGEGPASGIADAAPDPAFDDFAFAPNFLFPLYSRKGWDRQIPLETNLPGKDGSVSILIGETEPIEIQLDPNTAVLDLAPRAPVRKEPGANRSAGFRGYLSDGMELRPLPIGSHLDPETGVFSWIPGPGFIGEYRFVFLDRARGVKNLVTIRIVSKY